MQLNVTVTQSNITKGVRRSSTECAVALGIKKELEPDVHVSVTADKIRIGEQVLKTPDNVAAIVHAIDSGWVKYVRPFNFTLNLSD